MFILPSFLLLDNSDAFSEQEVLVQTPASTTSRNSAESASSFRPACLLRELDIDPDEEIENQDGESQVSDGWSVSTGSIGDVSQSNLSRVFSCSGDAPRLALYPALYLR